MTVLNLRDNDWKGLAAWAAGAALVGLCGVGLLQWSAHRVLLGEALAQAQASAACLADDPQRALDRAIDAQPGAAAAAAELAASGCLNGVWRMRLFDRQGRALGTPPTASAPASPALDSAVVQRLLRSGPQAALRQGSRWPAPQDLAEVLVPLRRGGQVLAFARFEIDHGPQRARLRDRAVEAATVAGLLLAVLAVAFGSRGLSGLRGRRRTEARADYLARHDLLCGVWNRMAFHEALARAAAHRGSARFAVLRIDLDRFKDINDTHGHTAGDAVLCQVGERLRDLARQRDTVARLGGDEFGILQAGVDSAEDLATLAQRVLRVLAQPYAVAGHTVHCGASVGGALFGRDAHDTEALMHQADLALFRAKSMGRGVYSVYDAALDQRLQRHRGLAQDLRDAIGTEALSIAYQPLIRGRDSALTGYEALLRWTHPALGPVPPSEFIALAEASGLIEALGRWVLVQACQEAARWPAPLSVAVNLSAAQFRQGRLVETVAAALDQAGLAADRLELEITETLLMSNTEQVVRTLRELSAMGVQIAMDDFGTGYSSLAYLWRFPFNKVKIDRAFTQHLGQDPKVGLIVRSIISLAHSLQMRVNAEGVETAPQREILLRHGCDELQGYLLGRPQPAHALAHRATPTGGWADGPPDGPAQAVPQAASSPSAA